MSLIRLVLLAAALLAGLATARIALAEEARMRGEFPAPAREASFLRSITISRIGGTDGPQLGFALERALNGPFEVLAGPGGRANSEGVLSGATSGEVESFPYTEKRKRCVERNDPNDRNKCTKEEEYDHPCTRRVVSINADLRIAAADSGQILYSEAKGQRDEVRWCRGSNPPRSVEASVSSMLGNIASAVRSDITPSIRNYEVRFRESRDGLNRDLHREFRDAVRLSMRDLPAACEAWAALNTKQSDHPSVIYDLGVCAEAQGNYEEALRLYQEAERLIPREKGMAIESANRIRALMQGRVDALERVRRRGGA